MKPRSVRFPSPWLLFLCGLTLVLGLIQAVTKPLWFDEIWTARIAFLPTWRAVFQATRTVDLNPPLDCLLVHLGRPLLGAHELAARFPSILGYTLAVGSLFWLLRLYVTPWFAASGALLLLTDTAVFYYASEARPYGLLLGFCALSVAAYSALLLSKGHATLLRVALFIGVAGMLLTHVFSVFIVGALLLAELIRTLRTRRLDAVTWAALLLPLGCCVLYPALFSAHGTMHYPLDMRPSLRSPVDAYIQLVTPLIRVFLVGALAVLLFVTLPAKVPETSFRERFRFMPEQYALFGILLAMPVLIDLLLLFTHPEAGYFSRYALVCIYPIVILLAAWVAWRSLEFPAVGKILFATTLLLTLQSNLKHPGAIVSAIRHGLRNAPERFGSSGHIEDVYPDLPLVAGDYQEFMEADERLSSSVLHRFYYLADTPAAIRFGNVDGYESMIGLRDSLGIRGNVVMLPAFVATHKDFLVIGDPARSVSWLLPWAQDQHADIRFLGNRQFMGDDLPLWRVTLP